MKKQSHYLEAFVFQVKIWVRELQRALGDTAVLIVVGNKLDLESERTVDRTEAIQ